MLLAVGYAAKASSLAACSQHDEQSQSATSFRLRIGVSIKVDCMNGYKTFDLFLPDENVARGTNVCKAKVALQRTGSLSTSHKGREPRRCVG